MPRTFKLGTMKEKLNFAWPYLASVYVWSSTAQPINSLGLTLWWTWMCGSATSWINV